jgi:hypothetical protein
MFKSITYPYKLFKTMIVYLLLLLLIVYQEIICTIKTVCIISKLIFDLKNKVLLESVPVRTAHDVDVFILTPLKFVVILVLRNRFDSN